MGYNANLLRVRPITPKKAAAGVAIYCLLMPSSDQRVTLPSIRLRAGGDGGNLFVLQTEENYRFSLAAKGAVLTIPRIQLGLTGRVVAIRYQSGDSMLAMITTQTGSSITLDTQVEASQTAMLYLLGSEISDDTNIYQLAASGRTIFESACPGVVVGKELGWPMVLYLDNADGNEQIEGGTVAFIGV